MKSAYVLNKYQKRKALQFVEGGNSNITDIMTCMVYD